MGEAVETCYTLGLITGIDSAGSFSPKGRMSRAQTAVIYVRLKKVLETGTGLAPTQTGTQTGTSAETSNGTLTNGKPVTEENVLALLEEYKNGKAPVWEKAIKVGFTSYKMVQNMMPMIPNIIWLHLETEQNVQNLLLRWTSRY